MAKIACRWPGGMTIAVSRPGGQPLTVQLAGPPGEPSLMPAEEGRRAPSRDVATALHKAVADTVKRLQQSSSREFDAEEYGVTDVSGQFWAEWFAENQGFDAVVHRMVFEL
jgi:hypothetical protein